VNIILKSLVICYVIPFMVLGILWGITRGSFLCGMAIGNQGMTDVYKATSKAMK
jgi:hypothetical protein